MPLAVPAVAAPLADAALWAVRADVPVTEMPPQRLTVLARNAEHVGVGASVPLGPALQRQGDVALTTVRTADELKAHARSVGAALR